ncbi:MAG: hypothetical protein ACOC0Z_08970, partial [Halohasta sp.]
MRLVRRLSTGGRLTRDSLQVLREHPRLLLFPLGGGSATLAAAVAFYLSVVVADLVDGWLALAALFGTY